LRAGYTYLHKDLRPGSKKANPTIFEGNDPENQVMLQSIMNLPAHFQLDADGRYVDTLHNPHVPSYVTFDVRLAWWWKDNVEISIVGQNLWDNQHPEFGAAATREEIPRSVFGKISLRF
jgi:iron complex outermembrane receptor protein